MIKEEQKARINGQITATEVRLIDNEGQQLGVVSVKDALSQSQDLGLDLVEVSPQAKPPVCRIMNYGKYLFEQNKKKSEAKKKQKQMQVKEIKLRPVTEEGDYQVKLRNLTKFLESGDKVKITLRFRGREMSHQELGMTMMKRIQSDLEELAVVEHMPKLEGRQMIMVMAPSKKKK
ncbi:translation initiation factor IF-3 [Thiotrichales bacterium 19S9-12]|nr:translation initiation factor IF-3 [Thiotrichales bacterium 19S9-11]MCF6812285.1 translation initiation factor IF-3 [Thiotrichales bacterium 19S9-12]